MRKRRRKTTWSGVQQLQDNRRVGDVRAEVRAALSRELDAGARRRAERRVRLLAGLLDAGGPGLLA